MLAATVTSSRDKTRQRQYINPNICDSWAPLRRAPSAAAAPTPRRRRLALGPENRIPLLPRPTVARRPLVDSNVSTSKGPIAIPVTTTSSTLSPSPTHTRGRARSRRRRTTTSGHPKADSPPPPPEVGYSATHTAKAAKARGARDETKSLVQFQSRRKARSRG